MSNSLVLLRHGQSQWNLENRFTGWVDVDLSPHGKQEAIKAGKSLKENGWQFDMALTSVLKRSIHTLWLTLQQLDQSWIPVEKHWQLNERHYGALQGLNKKEMMRLHGEQQVYEWRRGYAVQPPEMNESDYDALKYDSKYSKLDNVPMTESLADTYARVVNFWNATISALLRKDLKLLIVAHGNSLRALVKFLDNISDDKIAELNIPTGIPLVYHLDKNLHPIDHYYLADADELETAVSTVKHQTGSGN